MSYSIYFRCLKIECVEPKSMNIEYISSVLLCDFAAQYFVYFTKYRSLIVTTDSIIYHNIYGPAINFETNKRWILLDRSYRRHGPYNIEKDLKSGEIKCEINNEQKRCTITIVFCNYIHSVTTKTHRLGKIVHVAKYKGNNTYTAGIIKVQGVKYRADDPRAKSEIETLKMWHDQLCHLFFAVKLKLTHLYK